MQDFSYLSGSSSMHLSALSKIYSRNSFIVSHMPLPFSNFASNIGSGLPYFVTDSGVKTVCIPLRSALDRCRRHSYIFFWQIFMKSSTKSFSVFRNFPLSPFFYFFVSGVIFIPFYEIVFLLSRWDGSVPNGAFI